MTVDRGTERANGRHARHPALVEREAELSAIETAIRDTARGYGRLVVVEGEAGIGKSSVLATAADMALAHDVQVLRASGHELEQLHSFGVARTLLEPLVREAGGAKSLEGMAGPARRMFEPSADAELAGGDRLAILHAAGWLIVDASEKAPLLVVVDDLHWADEASLRFLAYLANRLDSLRVGIVVGTRPAASQAPEVSEQITAHRDAVRLPLRRLSREAVASVMERSPSGAGADPDTIWRQTGGNPFYVVELLHYQLGATELSADTVPDAIRASIRRRLAASGAKAQRVAEAIAVLADEADIGLVARLARVDEPKAVDAARAMTDRAILDHDGLRFTHPIVHATVLEGVPAALLAGLHRAAAELLLDAGRPATVAATHLVETPAAGDAWTVSVLRSAARVAQSQGDAAVATRLLRRAVAERPPADELGQVLFELASAEAAAGDPAAADRFEEAITHLRRPHERAQARLAHGHALIGSARWADGAAAFRAGLDDVDARDVELKSRLEAGYISSAYVGLTDRAEANARLERILAAPLHDPAHRELAAWTAFQQTMSVTAPAMDAAGLVRRAVDGAAIEQIIAGSQVVELAAGVLIATGDVADELEMLDRAISVARRMNAFQKVGIYSYCRSVPNLVTGRIAEAIADAETALAIHELGWEVFFPGTRAVLAWAHLERNDLAAASAAVEIDDARWEQRLDYQFMMRIARGRVRSALGDHAGAIEQYRLAEAAGQAIGVETVSILADWRSWCAIDLRKSANRAEAASIAERGVDLARRWGAAYGEGRALMAYGIAVGDRDGLPHLEAAVERLSTSPVQLEAARALIELGAAQRRLGRLVEARETLARATDLAHRLQAISLAGRAREELKAAGARPRRYAVSGVSALTPSELRVARLAAEGMTNRDVAEALFVTPKAIEYHLANTYRKLGIAGRPELAAALERDGETASV